MQHNSPARALHPCSKRTNEVQYTTIHAITSDFLSACWRAASKPSKTRLTQPWKMRKIWKFRFHLKCHQQQKIEAKMHGLPSKRHFYTQFSLKWCEALSYCEADWRSDPPALFCAKPPSTQHNSLTRAFHPCPKKHIVLQYVKIQAITSDLPSAYTCAASKPSKSATARPCKTGKMRKFQVHLKCTQQWKFEAKMHSLPPEAHF